MSNLDAIAKKLKEQQKEEKEAVVVFTPETRKQKAKRQEDCQQCGNRSMVKGFCIVCGYEIKV